MKKTNTGNGNSVVLKFAGPRKWFVEFNENPRPPVKSFAEAAGDIKLRRALKRAVERDFAPQSLIDSIRMGIRG